MTRPAMHPADILLNRLALDEAYETADADRAHVAQCVSCRAHIQDVQRLQALFTASATVDAIVAVPAQRVNEHSGIRPKQWRYVVVGLVAAGLAVFAYVGARRLYVAEDRSRSVATSQGNIASAGPTRPPVERDDEPGALSLWPSLAYASEQPTGTEAPYDPVSIGAADSIRPGTRVYVRSSASSYSDKRPISATEIEVTAATVSSVPAWRIVTTNPLQTRAADADPLRLRYDSVWLRKSDLQLLKRRWRYGMSFISQQRLGDSAIQQVFDFRASMMRLTVKDRSFKEQLPLSAGRLLVTDFASMTVLLRSLPLRDLWRGSIDVSGSKHGPAGARRSLNLSVQGDSVVATLWGYVPCWRVMLHTGKSPERWYVSKEGHELLLVEGPDGREWPRSRLDLIGRYLK